MLAVIQYRVQDPRCTDDIIWPAGLSSHRCACNINCVWRVEGVETMHITQNSLTWLEVRKVSGRAFFPLIKGVWAHRTGQRMPTTHFLKSQLWHFLFSVACCLSRQVCFCVCAWVCVCTRVCVCVGMRVGVCWLTWVKWSHSHSFMKILHSQKHCIDMRKREEKDKNEALLSPRRVMPACCADSKN